jgi:translation elongation factor EF-1beta
MCKADLDCLLYYIINNTDKKKTLDEIRMEFNSKVNQNKKLTTNEIAFGIRVLRMKNIIKVERPNQDYLFCQVPSVSMFPELTVQTF